MDAAFWLDTALAACAALCALVVAYGGWLCLSDLLGAVLDLSQRRSYGGRKEREKA